MVRRESLSVSEVEQLMSRILAQAPIIRVIQKTQALSSVRDGPGQHAKQEQILSKRMSLHQVLKLFLQSIVQIQ